MLIRVQHVHSLLYFSSTPDHHPSPGLLHFQIHTPSLHYMDPVTQVNVTFWPQGKSTLSNWLLQDERCLTGPEPGLTRDAVLARFEYGGRQVALVDTAGRMRRSRLDNFDDSGCVSLPLAFHPFLLYPGNADVAMIMKFIS